MVYIPSEIPLKKPSFSFASGMGTCVSSFLNSRTPSGSDLSSCLGSMLRPHHNMILCIRLREDAECKMRLAAWTLGMPTADFSLREDAYGWVWLSRLTERPGILVARTRKSIEMSGLLVISQLEAYGGHRAP